MVDFHAYRDERIVRGTKRTEAAAPRAFVDPAQPREDAFLRKPLEMCLGSSGGLIVSESQQQLSFVPDRPRLCKNGGMSSLWSRRNLLWVFAVSGGCARRSKGPLLPESAAGGWRLQDMQREQKTTTATYQGQGTVRVEVEDTGASVTAFDRAQRARPQPDSVFFYKENYFVTVKWEGADREAVKLFVRDLEKRLE
jgi:hypothetical protein